MKRRKIRVPRWLFLTLLGVLTALLCAGNAVCFNAPLWSAPLFLVAFGVMSLAPMFLVFYAPVVVISAVLKLPQWGSFLFLGSAVCLILLFLFFAPPGKD